MTSPRKAVLILGMHRSGTSALSGALSILGINFGRRLIQPNSANEKGFFENQKVYQLHEGLLDALDSSWDDEEPLPDEWAHSERATPFVSGLQNFLRTEFQSSDLFGVKDPRLTELLPLWLRVLREAEIAPQFILISRHPEEVAESLWKRDRFAHEKSYRLWMQHVFTSEEATRPYPRAFVTFPELLANPVATLARLGSELRIDWPRPLEEARSQLDEFLSEPLRHHRAGAPTGQVRTAAPALIQKMSKCLDVQDGVVDLVRLQKLREQVQEVRHLVAGEATQMKARLEQMDQTAQRMSDEFDASLGVVAVQVYSPARSGYSETRVQNAFFSAGAWTELVIPLALGLGDGSLPLRVDPAGLPGLIEISSLRVCAREDGAVLWSASDDFHEVGFGGTAQRLPHEDHLRVLSFGVDPQLFLPVSAELGKGSACELRLQIYVGTTENDVLHALGPALAERTVFEKTAAEKSAGWEKAQSENALLREQFANAEKQRSEAENLSAAASEREAQLMARLEQFRHESETQVTRLQNEIKTAQVQQDELHRLRASVANLEERVAAASEVSGKLDALEKAHAKSRRQFEASEWELSRARLLLENVQAEARSSAQQLNSVRHELATAQSRLEAAEHEAAENKVWRADLAARYKQSEHIRKAIETSAIWQVVKPLWKLAHRAERRRERAAAKGCREIVSSIDAPVDWTAPHEMLTVRGWCFARDESEIVGVRAKVGTRSYQARFPIERPDVAEAVGFAPGSSRSGFSIQVRVPRGQSLLRLEAISLGGSWEKFFEHELIRGEGTSASSNGTEPALGKPPSNETPDLPDCRGLSVRAMVQKISTRLSSSVQRGERPMFSILTPTFNTRPEWLAEAALSLLDQSVTDWEWCLVDDGSTSRELRALLEKLAALDRRFRVKFSEGGGISSATNQALEMAAGEYVGFLDHDDLLAPLALERMKEEFGKGCDAVYSDQDKLNDETRQLVEPFYKPVWSPEYLRGAMYVGHLLCVRRELAASLRFNGEFDGVQDFEFMLRLGESTKKIRHIPAVLYHWRIVPGSIADRVDAKGRVDELQQKAVTAHLSRLGHAATAEHTHLPHRLRITPARRQFHPRISVIVPTRDAPTLISQCLGSLYEKTSYPNFEVLLVDNDTTDREALAAMRRHPARRVLLPNPFNYSRANNVGAQHAEGEYLVFLNNDTEVVSADWLDHLLYYAEQPDVGAAGAVLLYPDNTVQHAGVVLGMRGTADHVMRRFPAGVDGYAGSLVCAREVSAVTAACLMIRKELFLSIGGLNEHFFTAYQDVDLCLRLRQRQLRIVCTPQAVLYHHESVSRKDHYDMIDRMLLLDQWQETIERGDPFYNRNLDLERGDYSPRPSS